MIPRLVTPHQNLNTKGFGYAITLLLWATLSVGLQSIFSKHNFVAYWGINSWIQTSALIGLFYSLALFFFFIGTRLKKGSKLKALCFSVALSWTAAGSSPLLFYFSLLVVHKIIAGALLAALGVVASILTLSSFFRQTKTQLHIITVLIILHAALLLSARGFGGLSAWRTFIF